MCEWIIGTKQSAQDETVCLVQCLGDGLTNLSNLSIKCINACRISCQCRPMCLFFFFILADLWKFFHSLVWMNFLFRKCSGYVCKYTHKKFVGQSYGPKVYYRTYCVVPRCSATFWTHPEIIPVGQFFRPYFLRSRFFRLIDDKLTWLVYWIRTARSVFKEAGLKWLSIRDHKHIT